MKGTGIHIHLHITDVTEGWVDTDGVDLEPTNSAYCAEMERRLQARYPGAEVQVDSHPNVLGSLKGSISGADQAEEEEIEQTIVAISDTLMNDSESWTVMIAG